MDRRGMTLGLCQGAALPTAHLLPRPVFLAPNNALGNSVPGWTWNPAEGILISDVGNVPGSVSTTINRSVGELTPTVGWGDAMGLHGGGQVVGDMAAYQAANPGLYMPECVPDAVRLTEHGGTGTGVFWPGMAPDAGVQTHNADLTAAGRTAAGHFEYRPEPVMPPGLALGWSQGHPASAGTAPYWEQIYYV
uniref:Uncharacterized protein n=1 Tax=Arundo donax TaxID=35708 RepID=A0A0A9G3D6_ARUDO